MMVLRYGEMKYTDTTVLIFDGVRSVSIFFLNGYLFLFISLCHSVMQLHRK